MEVCLFPPNYKKTFFAMYIIMRKKGCYGKSTYRYVVQEYDTWEHAKLVSKRYFKTQREIQSAYNISRSCIYHTMHHNLERIKKYNYLVIEKLLHPIPAHETVSVQLSDYETCSSSESEGSDEEYDAYGSDANSSQNEEVESEYTKSESASE